MASTPPDLGNHPGVTRVVAALRAGGVDPEVTVLPGAVRTAVLAAQALGVDVGQIANSLVFAAVDEYGGTTPLLVLASGAHRVDTTKVARELGIAKIQRADAEFVRESTGFAIGGVAPVGHFQPIRTVIDTDLARYDVIWAAAGHAHTMFPTTFADLRRISEAQPLDVA